MIISFLGNRDLVVTDKLKRDLFKGIEDNIKEDTVLYFGGYGNFDRLCLQVGIQIKEKYPHVQKGVCYSVHKRKLSAQNKRFNRK